MTNLASFFFFVPGALETALTVLVFLALFAVRKKVSSLMVPEALAYAFALRFVIQIVVDVSRQTWNPWLLVVLAVLSAIFFALRTSQSKAMHWVALLVGIVVYVSAIQMMTYVIKTKTEPVTWEFEDPSMQNPEQETLIHFQFENHPQHGFALSSNTVANYLKAHPSKKGQAEITGMYHWGAFSEMSETKINDFQIPLDALDSDSCTGDCSNPPFPLYDLSF